MLPRNLQHGIRFALVLIGSFSLLLAWLHSSRQSAVGELGRDDLQPSAGECGPETYPNLVFEEHVETGGLGWTHSPLWEISSWRPYSGTYAWHVIAPATIDDQSLFSPPIALPVDEAPLSLRFWGYQDFENSSTGCFDGALLEISSDGGQSWTQLDGQLLTDLYDGLIDFGSGNPLAGRPAWCGHPQDWLEAVVALDEFAGQTVQFRFRVGTDSSQGREGWYLDDLVVQSCPSAFMAAITPESRLQGLPGDQVVHQFRLENLGLDDQYVFQLEPGAWPALLLTPVQETVLSGQVFTVSVQVDLPAAPGGQLLEDAFELQVISVGNPKKTWQSDGITALQITPGFDLVTEQLLLSGEPGETVTHTFSLTNRGDIEDDFRLSLLGAEWPSFVLPYSGLLQPGEQKSIPVRVDIPTGPLRTATVVISDSFQLQAVSGWSSQVRVEVASSTRTDLFAGLLLGGPPLLDAPIGRIIPVTFMITNLGNFTDRYSLAWLAEWLATTPPAQTDWIAVGDQGQVTAFIGAPPQTTDGEISTLILRATSQLDPAKAGQFHLTIYGWKRVFLPLARNGFP